MASLARRRFVVSWPDILCRLSVFPDDFRLTETSFSVSPCLCLYGPGPRPVQVICPVALLSMFSLCPRSLRRGFVPVCGCKITTVFIPPQVFLCFTASFSEFLSATSFQSVESTNVKICFAMLIAKLLPLSLRYHLYLLSRIHAEKSGEPPLDSPLFYYLRRILSIFY